MSIVGIQILALAGAVSGTWMLQTAWRSNERNWAFIAVAWSAVACSLYLWSYTTGADKGVALGVVAWMAIVLLFLLRSVLKSPARPERALKGRLNAQPKLAATQIALRVVSAILIGPVAGLTALVVCTALFDLLQTAGLEHTANLTIVTIIFPVLWAGLAVVLGYQSKLWSRAITLAAIATSSLIYLWIVS